MLQLGASIGSFAPAVGRPLKGRLFHEVARWLEEQRKSEGWWLQGLALRGCAQSDVLFNSVEAPWSGFERAETKNGKRGKLRYGREKYSSPAHAVRARMVGCLDRLKDLVNSAIVSFDYIIFLRE